MPEMMLPIERVSLVLDGSWVSVTGPPVVRRWIPDEVETWHVSVTDSSIKIMHAFTRRGERSQRLSRSL